LLSTERAAYRTVQRLKIYGAGGLPRGRGLYITPLGKGATSPLELLGGFVVGAGDGWVHDGSVTGDPSSGGVHGSVSGWRGFIITVVLLSLRVVPRGGSPPGVGGSHAISAVGSHPSSVAAINTL